MDLKEVGHTIQIAGVIYNSDKDEATYLLMLPDENTHDLMAHKPMSLEQWEKFFWQTDVLEVEARNTMYEKVIVRKAERQIAGRVSWSVYKRDGYACRYCGKDGIPLTVDHVVLWEEGGPSIPGNLVTSCQKCNRTRGDTPYPEWIESKVYAKISEKLSADIWVTNKHLIKTLDNIPRSFTKMRGKKR
jgi:hypothetical protein